MITGRLPAELRNLDPAPRRVILGIAVAACLLRLFYWHYTGRTWEDALISLLHSENAGRGLGLTHYHPGYPPVHGFTSPLSVLIPLPADIFHPGYGLILMKTVSALLAIPTVLLAAAIALNQAFRLNLWLVYLLCAYLAFEHHQILWGMAGMETQIAVFALFLAMYHALKLSPVTLGVSMAVCLYTRPDYVIFLFCVAVYLLAKDRRLLVRSVAIGALLYVPWVVFTTLYYGSPVPNTIVAKGLGYPLWTRRTPLVSAEALRIIWQRLYSYIFLPLGPSHAGHGGGFIPFRENGFISRMAVLAICAGLPLLARRRDAFYIIPAGALLLYSAFYVFCVHGIFGWYLVPFSAVNCLLMVLALGALSDALLPRVLRAPAARLGCVAYILPFLWVLPLTFRTDRGIQEYIDVERMKIGRYLLEHKKPGDRVGCEPLGNIAYYSHMPVLDYPGLASPEVTGLIRRDPERRSLEAMLEYFRPEWIVLRQSEYQYVITLPFMSFLKADYALERVFAADPARVQRIFNHQHNIDRCFYLLKKKSGSGRGGASHPQALPGDAPAVDRAAGGNVIGPKHLAQFLGRPHTARQEHEKTAAARAGQLDAPDVGTHGGQQRIDGRIGGVWVQNLVQFPVPVEQLAKVVPVALLHGVGHLHRQRLDAVQHLDAGRLAGQVASHHLLEKPPGDAPDPGVVQHHQALEFRVRAGVPGHRPHA